MLFKHPELIPSETFKDLAPEQKEAVGLLSVGTFLEYFDLMLYVHMAVILNNLFFPKTDPKIQALLAAFAFCSTYVLRPFGAMIFGYIGDTIGRKATVVMTTFIMAISCLIMANVPTYAQIGISAAYIVTFCRVAQGMSSMGEIVGAELYLTEMSLPPMRYTLVAAVAVCGTLGMTAALAVASCVTKYGLSWRVAFWVGAGVALVGSVARRKLRESKEFIDAKRSLAKDLAQGYRPQEQVDRIVKGSKKVNAKTSRAYFLMECAWPVGFYMIYSHSGTLLKNVCGFLPEQIIQQNFMVSMVDLVSSIFLAYLVYRVHPLRVLKWKLRIFVFLLVVSPMLINKITTPTHVFMLQISMTLFAPTGYPAVSVLFSHFPVLKRFRYAAFTYALSRAVMYVTTSFGLVYLIDLFGMYGLYILVVPVTIAYTYGRRHFEDIETQARQKLETEHRIKAWEESDEAISEMNDGFV